MNNQPLKIYFFYCSNSLDPKTLNRFRSEQGSDKLKTIGLPCSGKVDILLPERQQPGFDQTPHPLN